MDSLNRFINWSCEYLIVYFVFIAAIILAVVIGIALRKKKNASEAAKQIADSEAEESNIKDTV